MKRLRIFTWASLVFFWTAVFMSLTVGHYHPTKSTIAAGFFTSAWLSLVKLLEEASES